ncbi:hypothetical protein Mgra_00006469 [Meloidogyne graminicola]|uniref:Uncharacterized protein n=1 Tax=Meloidogyne graminicola TaxID=189291 RepID=A0A8S9ZLJ9_9BILA|nr:hypothetical protein Mgra_00006469 [Meloidogyne graminicola]
MSKFLIFVCLIVVVLFTALTEAEHLVEENVASHNADSSLILPRANRATRVKRFGFGCCGCCGFNGIGLFWG